MTLATLGWAIVWASLGASKLGWSPPVTWVYVLAGIPAAAGLGYALMTVRAKRAWLYMAAIAIFANGTLLALPLAFGPEFEAALLGF